MMRSLAHYAVSLAVVLSTASCLIAQSSVTQKKSLGGTVTGKVTIKGKAAPGVVVGLRISQPATPFEPTYKATTDQEGKYRITDVLAGSYTVAPVAPAYVISDTINPRGQNVVLTEGENVEGIDFALTRGGVITGKVTDADGRPVIEQRVNLIAVDSQMNPQVMITSLSGVATDDRGIYRMFGLPAGRYKVSVGQGEGSFIMAGYGGQSYKSTFHPDVTDPAKATVLEVTEGSEAANVDIAIGRANQTFAASGRVINGENSQPVANLRFGLQLMTDPQHRSYIGTTATSNRNGEFRVEGLAPGKYSIYLQSNNQSAPDSDLRADAVLFDVLDQDVADLVIKTSPGMTVAGTIVLENSDDKAVFAKLFQLTVRGFVQSSGMSHAATINADGSFLMRGLEPGTLYLSLGALGDSSQLKGFSITRTERDGVVQPRGVEIKSGEQVSGLKIMVSYGNAIVHGVVKLENGTLPANARVIVAVTRSGERSPPIRPPLVDARGHFMIEGLPAGTYDFTARVVSSVPPPALPPPGPPPASGGGAVLFPRMPSGMQQVTVSEGAVNEVTITIDLSQTSGPPAP